MAVELDLPWSSPSHTAALATARRAAQPSSVEVSAEAADLIRTLDFGLVRPRIALVGATPWDASVGLDDATCIVDVDGSKAGSLRPAPARLSGRTPIEAALSVSSPLATADVIVLGDPTAPGEKQRPGSSALAEACATVAEAAKEGQVIIVVSAAYVGSTREFLVGPLERRGFVIGQDVHVAFSAALPDRTDPRGRVHLIGGATAACASAAASIVGQLAPLVVAGALEVAEATTLAGERRSRLGAGTKRAIDVVVACAATVILLPILALVALAIVLDDGGPVLFAQERVGHGGRRFRCWKFRTMKDGAEDRLHEVLELNQIRGPGFQLDRDPRVTRIGRFLRKSSLDELPQLWNVIRGEMSLVGPRPAPPVEVAAYEPWHRRRLTMKPGITGLAQIRARSYQDFDDKATQDVEYIDGWSPWLDTKIVLRTVPTVLRLSGR